MGSALGDLFLELGLLKGALELLLVAVLGEAKHLDLVLERLLALIVCGGIFPSLLDIFIGHLDVVFFFGLLHQVLRARESITLAR